MRNLTSSNCNGSTCTRASFFRRFWISTSGCLIHPAACAIPRMVIRAPGEGGKMFSNWDDLNCVWTQILRRIQILTGKFEIITMYLVMARSMVVAVIRVGWPLLNQMFQLAVGDHRASPLHSYWPMNIWIFWEAPFPHYLNIHPPCSGGRLHSQKSGSNVYIQY